MLPATKTLRDQGSMKKGPQGQSMGRLIFTCSTGGSTPWRLENTGNVGSPPAGSPPPSSTSLTSSTPWFDSGAWYLRTGLQTHGAAGLGRAGRWGLQGFSTAQMFPQVWLWVLICICGFVSP